MAIEVNTEMMERLLAKYDTDLIRNALNVMDTYTSKIAEDARGVIKGEGYVDTGRLINSIRPSVRVYVSKIKGEVNAGTKYARYIHEGAAHTSDTELVPRFVSFATAPGLKRWAKKHKIIERIRGDWYFIDNKNREHRIKDLDKSGLRVYHKPAKYFTKPFLQHKDDFIREMRELVRSDT